MHEPSTTFGHHALKRESPRLAHRLGHRQRYHDAFTEVGTGWRVRWTRRAIPPMLRRSSRRTRERLTSLGALTALPTWLMSQTETRLGTRWLPSAASSDN